MDFVKTLVSYCQHVSYCQDEGIRPASFTYYVHFGQLASGERLRLTSMTAIATAAPQMPPVTAITTSWRG
jgi:hypothetical protein